MKLDKLFDRPIAFHRVFVSLDIGITGALLLSQSIYWSRRCSDDNGWFFKNAAEWEEETGMTRREQETARKRLKAAGFIHEELRGVPATLNFKVDFDAILEALRLSESANQVSTKSQNQFQQKRESSLHKSAKPASTKRRNKSVVNEQTNIKKDYYRDYTETTTENITTEADATVEPMKVVAPNGMVYEIPGELKYPGEDTKTHKAWIAYAIAYERRYGAWPVWNAMVAGQISKFIDRVGVDNAPYVAVHYVRRVNEQFVVQQMHPVKLLLSDAEKWLTQAQTNRTVTRTEAQQADKSQSNLNTAQAAADLARQIIAKREREDQEDAAGGGHAE